MRFLILFLVSLVPLSCFAEPQLEAKLSSEHGVEDAQYDYEEADASVTDTFRFIMRKVNAGDYEDYMVPISVLDESLMDSQHTWKEYRDAHCYGVQTLMGGGASKTIDYLECLTELSKQREQQLRDLYL